MAESIAALRERCQAPAQRTDNFYTKHLARRVSIYVTSALIRTPITANQVTGIFLISGWLICGLFALGTPALVLLGTVLLHGWFVLDCVDGEIARYRRTSSVAGMYLDHMGHAMVRPFIFAALGFGVFRTTAHLVTLWSGIVAAISSVLVPLSTATKESVIKDVSLLALPTTYFAQPCASPAGEPPTRHGATRYATVQSAFRLLPRDPAVINLFMCASLIDMIGAGSAAPWRFRVVELVLGFYAGLLTLLWMRTVAKTVRVGFTAEERPSTAFALHDHG